MSVLKYFKFRSLAVAYQNSVTLSTSSCRRNESQNENETKIAEKIIDPAKDRTKVISVETSILYLKSKAFQESYGGELIWKLYRRNYKGHFLPAKTRKTCIRHGQIATGSPCPICRDEYLVLDYRNSKLLEQFISPYNGKLDFVEKSTKS